VEFFEQIEFAEGQNETKERNSQNDSKNAKDGLIRAKTSKWGKKRKAPFDQEQYCRLHGWNSTHDSAHCKNLKSQAEKMHAAYLTLPDFKKRFKLKNKTWSKDKEQDTNDKTKKDNMMFEAMKAAAKEMFAMEKANDKMDKNNNKEDPLSFDKLNVNDFVEL
jgi:hypothetical protein